MDARKLWFGKGLPERALRYALWPLSLLYALGWRAYLGLYQTGIKRAKHPHRPILVVGNLTTGGSGKSPLTIHLAQLLGEMGYDVVLSLSGYGSPRAEAAQIAPDGPLDAREWGDEPAMTRRLLPEVPLIVGRRRVLAAELCAERFPKAILLMDDGLQHLPLQKDLAILLDEPAPANPFCLPAGPYREPRSRRNSASLRIPCRFKIVELPLRFESPSGESVEAPEEANVLCALGRPEKFLESLAFAGVQVRTHRLLPDHDSLSAGTLLESFSREVPLTTTAKDWVKLRLHPDLDGRDIRIARHEIMIEPYEAFRDWLQAKLDEIGAQKKN